MPYVMDLKQELLNYTARFQRPALNLFGAGERIVRGLYDAFAPFSVPLTSFQLPALGNAGETVVTVRLGDVGTSKFSYEKTELIFSNFSEDFFQSIPKILAASTDWLRAADSAFKIASHSFTYFSHSLLKGSNVAEYLTKVHPFNLKSGGVSLGTGAIFNMVDSERNWQTQLMVDRSVSLDGGLFVSLSIITKADKIDYDKMMVEAREYFGALIKEIDLELPELSR